MLQFLGLCAVKRHFFDIVTVMPPRARGMRALKRRVIALVASLNLVVKSARARAHSRQKLSRRLCFLFFSLFNERENRLDICVEAIKAIIFRVSINIQF